MTPKGITTDIDVYRFNNAVQLNVEYVPTLYVGKQTARKLAEALFRIADDIDNKTYVESSITKIEIR